MARVIVLGCITTLFHPRLRLQRGWFTPRNQLSCAVTSPAGGLVFLPIPHLYLSLFSSAISFQNGITEEESTQRDEESKQEDVDDIGDVRVRWDTVIAWVIHAGRCSRSTTWMELIPKDPASERP